MSLESLRKKIAAKTAKLGVIGLGYVGLPVACIFADAGFDVVGIDAKEKRIATINRGISPIEGSEPGLAELLATVVASGRLYATTSYQALCSCEVVMINVETPVDEHHVPEYSALQQALRDLEPVLQTGALVIIESTLAPGTMARVVRPLLERGGGKRANADFYLGHCPERVMPGKLLANLRHMSRVCGGETAETACAMVALYRHIVQADLDPTDCITAELVKTAENAYRDVNIAFANEVALICEAVGGDVWKVRELVNKSPGRAMLLPGAGVGGHCIPKDPWLLAHEAQQRGAAIRLIPAARAVNAAMPEHLVALLEDALMEVNRPLAGARILVLGYAYLENSDDSRNSPSEVLSQLLHERGAEVVIHDPYVEAYGGDVMVQSQGCDAIVAMVAHSEYLTLDLAALGEVLNARVIVDGRRMLAQPPGWVYRCVGQGIPTP